MYRNICRYPPEKPFFDAIKLAYDTLKFAANKAGQAVDLLEDWARSVEDLQLGKIALQAKVAVVNMNSITDRYRPGRECAEELVEAILQRVAEIRRLQKTGEEFSKGGKETRAGFGDAIELQKAATDLASKISGYDKSPAKFRHTQAD